LELIAVFIVGLFFYTLAKKRNLSKGLYTLIGIGVYYIGSSIGTIAIAKYFVSLGDDFDFYGISLKPIGFFSVPFGLLSVWILYHYLNKKFPKHNKVSDSFGDSKKEINTLKRKNN
jgi:Na+(H+)/acetate symporter ActP